MSLLATYTELADYISDTLDRDDLAPKVGTFIRLAEARMNRLLDDPEMEVRSTATAVGTYTALPPDFGEMVSISTSDGQLGAVGPVEFAGFDNLASGIPRYYTIVDGSITFAPSNSTANIVMVYRRRIPSLTAAAPTNWLLSLAPDAYLYGALVQASVFLAEDERAGMWKSAFDEAIGELRMDASRRKWGAGPIRPRIRRG